MQRNPRSATLQHIRRDLVAYYPTYLYPSTSETITQRCGCHQGWSRTAALTCRGRSYGLDNTSKHSSGRLTPLRTSYIMHERWIQALWTLSIIISGADGRSATDARKGGSDYAFDQHHRADVPQLCCASDDHDRGRGYCLGWKNESGKTTILKALHRLNPANLDDISSI